MRLHCVFIYIYYLITRIIKKYDALNVYYIIILMVFYPKELNNEPTPRRDFFFHFFHTMYRILFILFCILVSCLAERLSRRHKILVVGVVSL